MQNPNHPSCPQYGDLPRLRHSWSQDLPRDQFPCFDGSYVCLRSESGQNPPPAFSRSRTSDWSQDDRRGAARRQARPQRHCRAPANHHRHTKVSTERMPSQVDPRALGWGLGASPAPHPSSLRALGGSVAVPAFFSCPRVNSPIGQFSHRPFEVLASRPFSLGVSHLGGAPTQTGRGEPRGDLATTHSRSSLTPVHSCKAWIDARTPRSGRVKPVANAPPRQ